MTVNACMEIILNTQVCIRIIHNFLLFKTFDNKSSFVLVMQEEKDKIANTVKGWLSCLNIQISTNSS
jgi:hypothetical protein